MPSPIESRHVVEELASPVVPILRVAATDEESRLAARGIAWRVAAGLLSTEDGERIAAILDVSRFYARWRPKAH